MNFQINIFPPRFIDPTVDCVFKTLLGSNENKHLLINFLNCFLVAKGEPPIVDVDIINPYNIKTHLQDKSGIVDVKATDSAGNIYQIEMQTSITSDLFKRIVYSWAKVCASGLTEGEYYSSLRTTTSIWILGKNLFPPSVTKAAHLCFHWHCPEEGLSLSEDNAIHLIQLNNLGGNDKMDEGRKQWIRFFKDGKHINLEDPPNWVKQSPVMEAAVKVLSSISEDRLQYLIYDSEEKARRETVGLRNALDLALKGQEQAEQRALSFEAEIMRLQQLLKEKDNT